MEGAGVELNPNIWTKACYLSTGQVPMRYMNYIDPQVKNIF